MTTLDMKAGPGCGAPEPRCIALQESAFFKYPQSGRLGKPIGPGAFVTLAPPATRQSRGRLGSVLRAFHSARRTEPWESARRDSEARKRGCKALCVRLAPPRFESLKLNQEKSGGGYVE